MKEYFVAGVSIRKYRYYSKLAGVEMYIFKIISLNFITISKTGIELTRFSSINWPRYPTVIFENNRYKSVISLLTHQFPRAV